MDTSPSSRHFYSIQRVRRRSLQLMFTTRVYHPRLRLVLRYAPLQRSGAAKNTEKTATCSRSYYLALATVVYAVPEADCSSHAFSSRINSVPTGPEKWQSCRPDSLRSR